MNIPITTVASQVYALDSKLIEVKHASRLSSQTSPQHYGQEFHVKIHELFNERYVQIPSVAATSFSTISPTSQNDIHICGVCKQNFSDINLFLTHKRAGCSRSSQKTIPVTSGTMVAPPTLAYINNTNPSGGDSSSVNTPIFRVIVDGTSFQPQQEDGNAIREGVLSYKQDNGDSNILRSRLLASQTEQQVAVTFQHKSSNNQTVRDLPTIMMQHEQQQSYKREFQIDEEAVATILANQLANKEISVAHEERPSRPDSVLGLGTMDNDIIIPEMRDPLDLEAIGIPNEETVTLGLVNVHQPKPVSKDLEPKKSETSSKVIVKDKTWTVQDKESRKEQQIFPCPPSTRRTQIRKRHDCTVEGCSFSTWYLKDLVRHMRKHTGERPFHCTVCQRSFSRRDKLQMHLHIHSGIKPHHCDVCGYATIDSGSLRKHMRIHNDERPYKCQICPYKSRDSSQLTVHLRTHTGDNPFVCPYEICTSAFKTSSDLKRHYRMHTGEKPFACEFCDYKCAIKSNLRVHLRLTHMEVKSIPCNSCSHISTSKRAAKEHEKLHAEEVLKCGICAYTCINTSSMKSHLRIHTQDKPFSCKHCSYSCRQQGNLKTHMKKKHPELRATKKGKPNGKDPATSGKPLCNRNTAKPLAHSKPFCYKSYQCTVCDAAFVREDSWRSHMRQHQARETALSMSSEDLESHNVPELEGSKSAIESDNLPNTSDILNSEPFMISINAESCPSKQVTKLGQVALKDDVSLAEVTSKDRPSNTGIVDSNMKDNEGKIILEDHDATQPVLLYVQNTAVPENGVDDGLRNAEILASLNNGAPILLTGRCGQYITLPTDQSSLMEQITATLQPGTTLQYVLSSPLESIMGADGTFIHSATTTESELASQVDASISIPSIISLNMEKEALMEDKN